MDKSKNVKPCPFCGSVDIQTFRVEDDGAYDENGEFLHPYYSVGCENCDAVIGNYDTKEQAIGAWNTRADYAGK